MIADFSLVNRATAETFLRAVFTGRQVRLTAIIAFKKARNGRFVERASVKDTSATATGGAFTASDELHGRVASCAGRRK
jgi:hypothetical protein